MKKTILVACFIFFNVFAVIKSLPYNAEVIEYDSLHIRGDCDRTVVNVYNEALKKSRRPFMSVASHFLYMKKNPGLFVFIVEMFLRAGVSSIFAMRMFFLLCFNVGVMFLIRWIDIVFKDDILTVSGLVFMCTTPVFLHYSSVMHQWPLDMLFFNMTLFFHVSYHVKRKNTYLYAAVVSFLFLCQSYYMYYAALPLAASGIVYVYEGRFLNKSVVLLCVVPVVSVLLLAAQISALHGGLFVMADFLLARMFDIRLEGSAWGAHESYLNMKTLLFTYPTALNLRMEYFYHFNGFFMIVLFALGNLYQKNGRVRIFLLMLFIAGASWNLFMIQHSRIHVFSVTYGYYAAMVIIGTVASAIHRSINLHEDSARLRTLYRTAIITGALLFCLNNGIQYDYLNPGFYLSHMR
ncbi:MAG: hypothetical protein ACOCWH_03755, partial [Spirochaetota bacterium]